MLLCTLCLCTHLSVEAKLLELVDAVDHHVHQRQQTVHIFGRCVTHPRHFKVQHINTQMNEECFSVMRVQRIAICGLGISLTVKCKQQCFLSLGQL